jgi:hypothetical protein
MKNSNDTIGNQSRDLPACSAVPQPTAPPRAPIVMKGTEYFVLLQKSVVLAQKHNVMGNSEEFTGNTQYLML